MAATFSYDVFLSHSSKDKPAIRKIAQRLKADGLRVWFDEWEIQPGDLIGLKIERGLQESRVLVLAMSSNTFGSDWVTLERHTALFRDPSNRHRRFIPVRLDKVNLPDTLKQFAYIDWQIDSKEAYLKLLRSCQPPIDEQKSSTDRFVPYLGYTEYQEDASNVDNIEPEFIIKCGKKPFVGAKPLVGVNVDYRSARKDAPPYIFLHAGYFNSLIKAGAVPMLIPPLNDETDLQCILDMLDGMLLVGGGDLDCRQDGFMLHTSMRLLGPRARPSIAGSCNWSPISVCLSWGSAAECNY